MDPNMGDTTSLKVSTPEDRAIAWGTIISPPWKPFPHNDSPKSYSKVFRLINALVECTSKKEMLEKLHSLPSEVQFLFALHDNTAFIKQVEQEWNAPGLAEAIVSLKKERFLWKDHQALMEFGEKNKKALDCIAKSIQKYRLDWQSTLPWQSGFDNLVGASFNRGKLFQGRLVYFFIRYPEVFPVLKQYIEQGNLPYNRNENINYEYTYVECHYYRAAILAFTLMGEEERAKSWLEKMDQKIGYYPTGSPKGFIADTKRIVANMR
jgi:hypothetical protein